MKFVSDTFTDKSASQWLKAVVISLVFVFTASFNVFSLDPILPDTIPLGEPLNGNAEVVSDRVVFRGDSMAILSSDTIPVVSLASVKNQEWVIRPDGWTPDPTRAVWMSALFPGLGQVYNRRYWKLPIIVGGYLGLGYATNWNNTMLTDYTKAYADLLDNDPTTKSYMNFFPSTVKEENLDKSWLTNVLKSRKNMYRRNRDLCVICMVGVYLLAMVDAYVDASLSHFDVSPDLSMDVYPALIQDGRSVRPSVGLQWALNF